MTDRTDDGDGHDTSLVDQPWWPELEGQITRHRGATPREQADRRTFLADAPSVTLVGPGERHLTASVIIAAGGSVLLHTHKRTGELLPVGGHVEVGETPWQAAEREAGEEAGVVLTIPPGTPPALIFVGPTRPGHVHYDVTFVARTVRTTPSPGRGESTNVAWYDTGDVELAGLLTDELRAVVAALADHRP